MQRELTTFETISRLHLFQMTRKKHEVWSNVFANYGDELQIVQQTIILPSFTRILCQDSFYL